MLKLAWQKKPSLFVLFILSIFVGFGYEIISVIMPKFVIDEAAAIIGGGGAEHIKTAALYI